MELAWGGSTTNRLHNLVLPWPLPVRKSHGLGATTLLHHQYLTEETKLFMIADKVEYTCI